MSDKPFAPTAQRLRKARSEGNLPKAQELATLCSFIGVAAVVAASMSAMTQSVAGFFIEICASLRRGHTGEMLDLSAFFPYGALLARTIGSALALGCVLSCAIGFFATRGVLTGISVKFERIAPMPHIAQLLSMSTVTALLRAACSAVLATALILPFAFSMVAASIGLHTPLVCAAQAWNSTITVLAVLACVGIAVASIEVLVTLRKRSEKLRMSHDEVRRESKEQQGDPHLRSTRKRRHRALMRGGVAAVKRATVVVTNPTHLAIALLYAPPEVPVPCVIARAADEQAAEIRKAACAAGIPCIEHVPLARLLFAECEDGDPIPTEAYALVAPIIAAVIHAKTKEAP